MKKIVKEWWQTALVIMMMLVLSVLHLHLVNNHRISLITGSSMEPSYHSGEWVTAFQDKLLDHGSVVLARDTEGTKIIKRVIAMGGDTIEIRNGAVVLNGIVLDESYTADHGALQCIPPYTVPDGYIYLLGDNRDYSFDSRHYGCVRAKEDILVVIDQQRE